MRSLRFPLSIQFPIAGGLRRTNVGLRPETPFYAIGDIHGRADLLGRLLRQIKDDAARHQMDRFHLVFLGDYVDRGYGSARVLQMLHQLSSRNPAWVTCLMGNHEKMLLDFLEDPDSTGPEWLRNGGRWTLESYNISLSEDTVARPHYKVLADALYMAMPKATRIWLTKRPLLWRSGNVACVHAGADPAVPIEAQRPDTLLWGHRNFASTRRADGHWIVHGHTIVASADVGNGQVAVDTGAYATGRLSAVAITPDGRTRTLVTGS